MDTLATEHTLTVPMSPELYAGVFFTVWGVSASNPCIVQGSNIMSRRKMRPKEIFDMCKVMLLDKGRLN